MKATEMGEFIKAVCTAHQVSADQYLECNFGYRGYHVKGSPIKIRKYQTCFNLSSETLRLDREQINNCNDTTK